jgi:hypothetical protein
MLTNLGVKLVPFLHIKPHTPHNFLMTCMLTKGIPLNNKYFGFPFYLSTNLAFNNVQGSIFLYKQLCPWEFCKPYFLELSCYIIIPLLDAYVKLDGLIIFSIGGRPIKRHGHIFNVICIGRIKTITRK